MLRGMLLRQERSRPLLDVIKKEMETAQAAVLPASALGKAISYTLSLWAQTHPVPGTSRNWS